MKINVYRLESIVTATHLGVTGMITNVYLNGDKSIRYVMQPCGLDKDGQPRPRLYLDNSDIPDTTPTQWLEYPDDILLSQVEDIATGFKGTVKRICWHLDGCVHACVQPKGTTPDGKLMEENEFDLRRLKGAKVPARPKPGTEEEKKVKPSPSSTSTCNRRL